MKEFFKSLKISIVNYSKSDAPPTNVLHRVHKKNLDFCFLSISPSNLYQIQKVRSVLKSAHPEDFKTVLDFEFWPSRSWDIEVRTHQGSFPIFHFFAWIYKKLFSFSSFDHSSWLSKSQFDISHYFLKYFPHKSPNF